MAGSASFKVFNSADVPQFLSDGDISFLSSLNLSSVTDEAVVLPGFCDVHVHFREPGFFYKETIASGSLAAAHGGYTTVLTMPNLDPVPDNEESIRKQLDIIERDAVIDVKPYGSITVGQKGERLSDMDALAPLCAAFSDDGKGVQSEELMREAMLKAKSLGKLIVAHCEDNSLLYGGYIHDGVYAAAHGHRGICSESEWKPIERDLKLAADTGCGYHVCHISCKESAELIRDAKKSGVNVTCETAPHYLLLDENELRESGDWKMNPPLRSKEDRLALVRGVADGTVDMIATDHAPHSAEEKSRGLEKSAFGIVGIETSFSLLYTELVKTGIIPLEKLTELLCTAPRKRFNLPLNGYNVWALDSRYNIDTDTFLSKGRSTPFAGRSVYGKCLLTVCGGKIAYNAIN